MTDEHKARFTELNEVDMSDLEASEESLSLLLESMLELSDEALEEFEDELEIEEEEISKPFTASTVPEGVKGLPKHAREIWASAFNASMDKGEESASRIAWSAVKNKYAKGDDGKWHLKKSEDGEHQVSIVKYDDDGEFQGLLYGVVLSPYDEVPTEDDVDSQADVVSKLEVEIAAHGFMERGHRLDLQHGRLVEDSEACVVESYLSPVTYETEYNGEKHIVKQGDWVMVTQLKSEELRELAKSGDINFYSIKGSGYREEVTLGKQDDGLIDLLNRKPRPLGLFKNS